MKLLLVFGMIAAPLAFCQKAECSNFLQINSSRKRRQATTLGYASSALYSTGYAVTSANIPVFTTTSPAATTKAATTKAAVQTGATSTEPSTTTPSPPPTTTTISTTTTARPTTQIVTTSAQKPFEYIIYIDASGSMQKLGGMHQGQKTILSRINQFLANLRDGLANGQTPDGRISFITFNKAAFMKSYDSINDVQDLTRADVKLGGPTNLYSALGCGLEHLNDQSPNTMKKVFIISDGRQQMPRALRDQVYYTAFDLSSIIDSYRNNDVEFKFFAATGPQFTNGLKQNARHIGFLDSELFEFDFSTNGFDTVLTKISSSINAAAVKEIPACKCPKKLRGRKCIMFKRRQRRAGKCQ